MQPREIICKTCGKDFLTKRSREVKYCSLECAWASKDRCRNLKGLWSDNELNILRDEYKKAGTLRDELLIILSRKLNRTRYSVCMKARRLGLTNRKRSFTEKEKEQLSIDNKLYSEFHEHPRGFLGHRRTEKWKKEHGNNMLGRKLNLTKKQRKARSDNMKKLIAKRLASGEGGNVYSRCKRGRAKDLNNIFFRSKWERNYARYLEWLKKMKNIKEWQYEPDRFDFKKIRSGCTSYLPDFKITNNNDTTEYHEVKGWMDSKSKTKLKRMKKYYPDVKIILIEQKEYYEIKNKVGRLIPFWE